MEKDLCHPPCRVRPALHDPADGRSWRAGRNRPRRKHHGIRRRTSVLYVFHNITPLGPWWLICIGWVCTCEWPSSSEADAAAQKAVDGMAENIQSLARERGLLLDFLCMSFATGSQGVLRSYGVGNVKRMQDVAEKYDPDGVFQKLQNGGFLLRDI